MNGPVPLCSNKNFLNTNQIHIDTSHQAKTSAPTTRSFQMVQIQDEETAVKCSPKEKVVHHLQNSFNYQI